MQTPTQRGFTLIEVMVVAAIVSILALIAVPSFQSRIIRTQVAEGLVLADLARQGVASYYAKTGKLPPDNLAAGLPPADRIVGKYVSEVAVRNGAIHIRFGNQANGNLSRKLVTLRPAVVPDYPQVPITWVCSAAPAPEKMKTMGEDATDLAIQYLPLDCLARPVTAGK